jgi:transposase
MDARQEKALEIAAKSRIVKRGESYIVPSQSGPNKAYRVEMNPEQPTCTCPDFEYRLKSCKHIFATEIVIERERTTVTQTDGEKTVTAITEKVRVTYKQQWTAYNAAQTQEQSLFQKLLHELCAPIENPARSKGRKPLPYSDMLFAAVFKVYSTMSSRRFASDLRDARAKGYISHVPHFNSVLNYLESETSTPILYELIARASLPLKALESDFAIDSSGFSTHRFVRWFDAKYGKEMTKQQWIKCHLMCGVKTNVVTAIEVTQAYTGDSRFFEGLVTQTAQNFDVAEVSGDKAYSSRANLALVKSVGAVPYVPFKSNAIASGKSAYWDKMFNYYMYRRDEFLAHYHKRSNVESTFSMIKRKFGDYVRSKTDTALINETLAKVLCHNICCVIQSMFEFDIVPTFTDEALTAEKAS